MPRAEELLKVRVPIATHFKIHEVANADGVARRPVQRVVMTYNAEDLAASRRAALISHTCLYVLIGEALDLALANGKELQSKRIIEVAKTVT